MTKEPLTPRLQQLIDEIAKRTDQDDAWLSYRQKAELDLANVTDTNRVWWQHVATAGVWALLAIADAIDHHGRKL